MFHSTVASKGIVIVIVIIIIITFGFCRSKYQQTKKFSDSHRKNQMNISHNQHNCTMQCECSTDSSKMLYTTHIS